MGNRPGGLIRKEEEEDEEVKMKRSSCASLIKHHAIKTYGGIHAF
jgi:hypothetical protein